MKITKLSKRYLVKKLGEEDIGDIFSLCEKNKEYYEYCPPMITESLVKEDMYALPENKTLDDKYYVGLYDSEKLIAILDLIEKYPDENTIFIGLLMLDIDIQNKGIGSLIFNDLCEYLKDIGYKYIRLAWILDNKKAKHFWLKNGFEIIKQTKDYNNHSVELAQRSL